MASRGGVEGGLGAGLRRARRVSRRRTKRPLRSTRYLVVAGWGWTACLARLGSVSFLYYFIFVSGRTAGGIALTPLGSGRWVENGLFLF